MNTATARFRDAYAEHRAREGRGAGGSAELLSLPFLEQGRLAREWAVRARTYNAFLTKIVMPLTAVVRQIRLLDLGAGNGWLCYRMTQQGHWTVALDWRRDATDGLGAAAAYLTVLGKRFPRVGATFEALPVRPGTFDLVVFNASLHYTENLEATLTEAVRALKANGRIAVLDSPFYARASHGDRMVKEKRERMARALGAKADALLGLRSIEYLTRDRLTAASRSLSLDWRHHRVRYPLWYEMRGLSAMIPGRRARSRFDLWEGALPRGSHG